MTFFCYYTASLKRCLHVSRYLKKKLNLKNGHILNNNETVAIKANVFKTTQKICNDEGGIRSVINYSYTKF